MKRYELFPVTVFKTQVNDNETLKRVLVPHIMDSLDELEIPEDWTTNKLFTSFNQKKNFIENNKNILLNI